MVFSINSVSCAYFFNTVNCLISAIFIYKASRDVWGWYNNSLNLETENLLNLLEMLPKSSWNIVLELGACQVRKNGLNLFKDANVILFSTLFIRAAAHGVILVAIQIGLGRM